MVQGKNLLNYGPGKFVSTTLPTFFLKTRYYFLTVAVHAGTIKNKQP